MANNYYKVTRWLETGTERKRADCRYFEFDSHKPGEEIRAADKAFQAARAWGTDNISTFRATDRGFVVIGETPRVAHQLEWAAGN